MHELHWAAASAAALALAASATAPPTRTVPPRGRPQDLLIRTDPAGASCSIVRDNAIVGTVEATPGTVTVPRRNEPIDVVCGKDGYLDMRASFAVASASNLGREEGSRTEITGGRATAAAGAVAGLGGGIAGISALSAGSLGAMATASGVMLGGQVLMLVGAIADSLANPPYAFRPLPEFFLVPATFPSEAQREAFFDTLAAKLTDATARQRASVNEHCIPWPCKLGRIGLSESLLRGTARAGR
jgi:hypothetical protein